MAALPGCSDDAPAPAPVPAPPRPADPRAAPPAEPRPRGPAGEVPPNSRKVHDEGRGPDSGVPGFTYAFPGVPGTGTHYHVLVPDGALPGASLAGPPTERSIALRIYRVKHAADAALAVRDALLASKGIPAILDPVTAAGCSDPAGHGVPGTGLRTPPPIRVVRTALDAGRLPEAEKIVDAVPGLERLFERRLGGPPAGEVLLDVHLIEEP